MRRLLLTPLATMLGAAALVVAPVALATPASAAPVVMGVITPDDVWEFDEDYNHPEFWMDYLWDEEGIDAWCIKDDSIDKPYTIPDIEDAFELEEGEDPEGLGYVLAVLKGGADENANELYWEPSAGDQLSHSNAGNSHVILCIAEYEEESPSPSPSPTVSTKPSVKPTVTGPVVETDRVGDSASVPGLGLAAAGTALVAGAGVLVLSRRRQGSHR